ncbi:hypothetical protein [Vibrio paucivorans]
MRKIIVATALAMACSPALANPDSDKPSTMSNFSYDYAEARFGISPVTFGGAFSKSIHPNAHFIARIDSEFESDYDSAIGAGFHAPINNWADVTGQMMYRLREVGDSGTQSGVEFNLGIRQWLGPQLEVGGKAGYQSIDDDDDWLASAYARFHATELFSLGAEMRFNDTYGEQAMITARFNL